MTDRQETGATGSCEQAGKERLNRVIGVRVSQRLFEDLSRLALLSGRTPGEEGRILFEEAVASGLTPDR